MSYREDEWDEWTRHISREEFERLEAKLAGSFRGWDEARDRLLVEADRTRRRGIFALIAAAVCLLCAIWNLAHIIGWA